MKLAFFICRSRNLPTTRVSQDTTTRLALHPQLRCNAFECRDYAQFCHLQQFVAKINKAFWCEVRWKDENGLLHPIDSSLDYVPTNAVTVVSTHTETLTDLAPQAPTVNPAPQDNPVPAPESPEIPIADRLHAALATKAKKLPALATELGITAETLKSLIAASDRIVSKQGGWIALKEGE